MIGIKLFPQFCLQSGASIEDERFLEALCEVKNCTNAQYVNYSLIDYSSNSLGMKHFLTYPMAWISHYVKHSYQEIDPLLRIDYRRVSFVDWSELWRTKNECRFFSSSLEYGIGDNGLSFVSHLGDNVYGALSLVYQQNFKNWISFREQNLEMMRFQTDHMCDIYLRLYSARTKNDYHLTKRELECLQWVALGKTDAQISSLMGIGRWTVVGHIKSSKYKLETPNRTAAVARAVTCGLLNLSATFES